MGSKKAKPTKTIQKMCSMSKQKNYSTTHAKDDAVSLARLGIPNISGRVERQRREKFSCERQLRRLHHALREVRLAHAVNMQLVRSILGLITVAGELVHLLVVDNHRELTHLALA